MIPASIRYNNPGAMWGGNALTKKWGETGNVALNDGLHQNNHIAVFPDKVHGAAAQFDLWHTSQNYHNQQLYHAIRIWSGGNSWPAYVDLIGKLAPGLTATTIVNDALLSGPQGLALVKAQAQMEAGGPYPMTDTEWAQAQAMVFGKSAPVAAPVVETKPAVVTINEVSDDAAFDAAADSTEKT